MLAGLVTLKIINSPDNGGIDNCELAIVNLLRVESGYLRLSIGVFLERYRGTASDKKRHVCPKFPSLVYRIAQLTIVNCK